ncbi:MAG: RNA polymerase sigma factor [Niastella sp.]|nr:RNA polymerase sigma factor [Niastella sp.]
MLKDQLPDFVPDRMDSHEQQTWLYNHFSATLLSYASNLLRDKEEGNEVVQDVFAYLVVQQRIFGSYEQAKATLFVATRNKCYDKIKQRMRQEAGYRRYLEDTRPDLIAYMEQRPEENEAHLPIIQILAKVNEFIAQLPYPDKDVLVLKWIQGKSYEEICAELDIKKPTARNYVSRAKKALLKKMRDGGILSIVVLPALASLGYAFTNAYYLLEIISLTTY